MYLIRKFYYPDPEGDQGGKPEEKENKKSGKKPEETDNVALAKALKEARENSVSKEDYEKYVAEIRCASSRKDIVIFFANQLYGIPLTKEDKQLLWKTLSKNKKFLDSLDVEKEAFRYEYIEDACAALVHKRMCQ